MSREITNPLQALIEAAASRPALAHPALVAARREAQRANRPAVIVCDVSSSMAERAGARRRIDHLRDALHAIEAPNRRVIAFSSTARFAAGHEIGEPSGGTAMHLALDLAATVEPRLTIVISDGQPDDASQALRAAGRLGGPIETIYCGPDWDRDAVEFMRRLATATGGRSHRHLWSDGAPRLSAAIDRLLISGPAS